MSSQCIPIRWCCYSSHPIKKIPYLFNSVGLMYYSWLRLTTPFEFCTCTCTFEIETLLSFCFCCQRTERPLSSNSTSVLLSRLNTIKQMRFFFINFFLLLFSWILSKAFFCSFYSFRIILGYLFVGFWVWQ